MCWDLSDPLNAASGEVGARAYPQAAAELSNRNSGRPNRYLNSLERKILGKYFPSAVVDGAHLHFGSSLIEGIGVGPYRIGVYAEAQTYGYDIYIREAESSYSIKTLLSTLAHEMTHVKQFLDRGSDLSRFGRDYFESFEKSGNYYNITLEKEAFALEESLTADISGLDLVPSGTPWNFEICNNSENEEVSVAVGRLAGSSGFSLIPFYHSIGWYRVKRSTCSVLASNIPRGEPVWYYATSDNGDSGLEWSGAKTFCIDTYNAFDIKGLGNCDTYAGFKDVNEPDANILSRKINLTGKKPNQLEVCNKNTAPIDFSLLQGHTTKTKSGWRNVGPYHLEAGACSRFDLGHSQSPVYLYAKDRVNNLEWTNAGGYATCFYESPFEVPLGMNCKGGRRVITQDPQMIAEGYNYHAFYDFNASKIVDKQTPPSVSCSASQLNFDGRCYEKSGTCEQFNYTKQEFCETSADALECSWSAATNHCVASNATAYGDGLRGDYVSGTASGTSFFMYLSHSISARNGIDAAKNLVAGQKTLSPKTYTWTLEAQDMLSFGWTSSDRRQSTHAELWFDGSSMLIGDKVVIKDNAEVTDDFIEIPQNQTVEIQGPSGSQQRISLTYNGQSRVTVSVVSDLIYCASASSDPDGDGWGWENNKSCKVAVVEKVPTANGGSTTPLCTNPASDPDGDGWGWENNTSCLVPKTVPEDLRFLKSNASGKCLEVPLGHYEGGVFAHTQLWDCYDKPNTRWSYQGFNFRTVNHRCLEVSGVFGSLENREVQSKPCDGSLAQILQLRNDGSIETQDKLCLEMATNPASNGTHIVARTCSGALAQKWTLIL